MSRNNKFFETNGNGRLTHEHNRILFNENTPKHPPDELCWPKHSVRPKTKNQAILIEAIENHDIIFCLGPAGTGKTHIAAGMAAKLFYRVDMLDPDKEKRIVGVRPALEAGRSLGFLPGDLEAKIDPYLKPLFNELSYFIPKREMRRCRSGEFPLIEIAPLQYMRGWTFKDSIVILDEAQNALRAEIDMFLTRMGNGTKLIINGDVSRDADGMMLQCDLPLRDQGALEEAVRDLADLDEVAVVVMTDEDCVRHPLVEKILRKRRARRSR